jgi:hypothetical protein
VLQPPTAPKPSQHKAKVVLEAPLKREFKMLSDDMCFVENGAGEVGQMWGRV